MKKVLLLFVSIWSYTYIQAATISVCASGCDQTTITAAIAAATAGDIIDIQDATHTEAGITIDKNLTIQGQGQTTTIVQAAATQAAATDRVFTINTGLTVTFQNLTIQNGNTTGLLDGGGLYINCNNSTNITFTNVTITNCRADDDGGGMYISGSAATVTMTNCVISNNEANATASHPDGGGIFNTGATTFTLTRCTITGNTAGSTAGGIVNNTSGSTAKFINCTIANNTAGLGASASSGILGGGLRLEQGNVYEIINCTIVGNTMVNGASRQGGGICHRSGTLNLINTIVANNSGASSASNGDDIYADAGIAITQTTSLVEDCDNGSGTCATFSYTSDANIGTTAGTCGVHTVYGIAGSDAQNNGTAPSGDIPTTDICGNTRAAAHDIGAFDIAVSVPVELIDFQGQSTTEGVLLTWQTASEQNNEGFKIQRAVGSIQHTMGSEQLKWEEIGFVAGHGTTQDWQAYDFMDEYPAEGTNYYRLRQVDFDGAYEYSRIVEVRFSTTPLSEIRVFPNPVKDELTVLEGEGQATIYNLIGQPINEYRISNSEYRISTQNLSKGQYILHITKANGNIVTKQFVKN